MTAMTSDAQRYRLRPKSGAAATTQMLFRPTIDVEQVRACWTRVEQLFKAIQARDEDAILAAYAADCVIDHPLIGRLSKDDFSKAVAAFIRQTPDYRLEFQINHAGTQRVEAEWTITHTFHLTGRTVRLAGTSTCFLSANRITRQFDRFDRRDWSRQALGLKGLILSFVPGWRRFVAHELRRTLGISPQ